MELTISSIRCVLQVALLGAVTPNLRAVIVETEKDEMTLYFYYDEKFSEEEEENAEVVATEVMTDFLDHVVNLKHIVLPYPEKLPEIGIRVFQRYEAYFQE